MPSRYASDQHGRGGRRARRSRRGGRRDRYRGRRQHRIPPTGSGADLVVDAIGVLEAHGVAAAHLVGVSAGAFAQLLALGFPERALSLVLISTSPALPVAAELPPPTEQFVRFVQTAEVDWTDAGSVIEYPVEYQRVLAGTERPFDKAAARQRGGWLREPIQATGDHRLHARRNRRVRLQRRTAVPEDHRLPRPRHPRHCDRTRPRPSPRSAHRDQGGRYRPHRLTVTPGPPPKIYGARDILRCGSPWTSVL